MDIYKKKSKKNYKIHDFMQWGNVSFLISGILFFSSLLTIKIIKFDWGLDFTGGTIIEMHLEKNIDLDVMRNSLLKLGFIDPKIQYYGSTKNILIRLSPKSYKQKNQEISNIILNEINTIKKQNITIKRISSIGPNIGKDLKKKGFISFICALTVILCYISFRFEWRLGISIVASLLHDVIITLGFLSFFHIPVDLNMIAALMSVLGYSLNDSIVVSDRIRENFLKITNATPYDLINLSITQTLGRTIITSITILTVGLILLVFGGFLLKSFSITMIIGILIGTISSIYISSALSLKLGIKKKHLVKK